MDYFQSEETFVKIAEESVIVMIRNQEDGIKTYHRNGETIEQIFEELGFEDIFVEITQKEYEAAFEVHRTYQPF